MVFCVFLPFDLMFYPFGQAGSLVSRLLEYTDNTA